MAGGKDMEYFVKVTSEGVLIPNNIPNGYYRLVPMVNEQKLEKDFSVEELIQYASPLVKKAMRSLQRSGYERLSDFIGITDAEILRTRNISYITAAHTILFLRKYGIDVPITNITIKDGLKKLEMKICNKGT